jgi:uncharacterized RDD family membrane protein YckC
MSAELPAVEYVGFWSRTAAALIDIVLSAVILQPVLTALLGQKDAIDLAALSGSPEELSTALLTALTPHGLLDFLQSWLLPALAVIAFWVARQATPGKMLIHARIVDATSFGKPSTLQMVGRYLGYYVSLFAFGLGFFWVGWDARKQGWHDKLAGTAVIRARGKTRAP